MSVKLAMRPLSRSWRRSTVPRCWAQLAPSSTKASPSASPPASAPAGELLRIRPGPIGRSRLQHHYTSVLAHDLLYMTYSLPVGHAADGSTPHRPDGRAIPGHDHPAPESKLPAWDPEDPYAVNRPRRDPKGGSSALTPKAPRDASPASLPRLDKVVLSIHVPTAVTNRKELLGAVMLLRLLTGEPDRAALAPGAAAALPDDRGVKIARTRSGSVSFRMRRDMPCGASVALKGPRMYAFLDALTTFVLPRMKDFRGFRLPPADAHRRSVSAQGGQVSIGLPEDSMGLWPGVEESLENWPRKYGMNVHFVTNVRGPGAQEKARALISGFKVPFVTRDS